MATAVANPTGQENNVGQDVIAERTDYVVGYLIGKDEKTGAQTKEPAFFVAGSEQVAKMVAEGKFEEDFTLTVSLPIAKTQAGIEQICPDVEERCNNFNRGAKQKGANRLKASLLAVDADGNLSFNPQEELTNGVFDLTSEIASPTKRKSLTEAEKVDRFLDNLPPAVAAQMRAAYAAAAQAK